MLATARNFGMVLGIGLAGAILTTHLAQNSADALYRGVDVGWPTGPVALINDLQPPVDSIPPGTRPQQHPLRPPTRT